MMIRKTMRVIVSGKNFSLTPSLKMYVQQRILKLQKYFSQILKARIELDADHNQRSGDIFRVEIWLFLPKKTLQVGLKAQEMHEAFDLAFRKIETRLIRYKEKLQTKIRRARLDHAPLH